MPKYFQVQAEFPLRANNALPLEIVAACENAAGVPAKTWGSIDKGQRFRVLFLAPDLKTAEYWNLAIFDCYHCLHLGRIEVKLECEPTTYEVEPYKFRIGSDVRAKCDVTDCFDERTLADMGTKGKVYGHNGYAEFKVLFENGDPEGHLVTAAFNELEPLPPTTNSVLIE